MAEENKEKVSWKDFIDKVPDHSICPYIRNGCISDKCKLWLSNPEQPEASECAIIVQAACSSALITILSNNMITNNESNDSVQIPSLDMSEDESEDDNKKINKKDDDIPDLSSM